MSSAPTGLFVRKASGLVREMGWRDSFAITLSGINPSTVVALFSVYLVFSSAADLSLPYVVAALAMVPLALTYAQLVATMPRSGGDFVYFGRIFHPVAGAAVGGALLSFFLLGLAANAVFVGQLFVPNFVAVAGDVLGWPALTRCAETLGTSQWAWFATSGAIVVGGCAVGLRGSAALARVMFWCFVVGCVAVAVAIVEALTHGGGSAFQAAYDARTAPGAYDGVVAGAREAGIATGATLDGFLKILPFAATGFWGFTVANFPSGELKRAGRTYLVATLAGLAAGALLLVGAWLAVRHLAGLRFLQSAAALSAQDPDAFAHATGGGAPTTTAFYVDLVASNPVSRLVVAGGFVVGGLLYPLAMVLVVSRLTFALSFDRLLPRALAAVDARRHAPVAALAFCALGGLAFVALTVFSTGYVRVSRNGVIVWAVLMTGAGVAGAALPYRRRDLYAGGPKVLRGRWLGVAPITWVAVVVVLTQGTLAYYALTNDAISGGFDAGSIAYLVGTAVLGVVLYGVSRAYLKRAHGLDLSLAMRELPPE